MREFLNRINNIRNNNRIKFLGHRLQQIRLMCNIILIINKRSLNILEILRLSTEIKHNQFIKFLDSNNSKAQDHHQTEVLNKIQSIQVTINFHLTEKLTHNQ